MATAEMLRSPDGVVGRDLMRRATAVQMAARRQAGVSSGRLRRSIVKRGPSGNDRKCLTMTVGSTLDYALLHHEGTSAHTIVPVHAKRLHFKVGGVDVFATVVHHPGTKPNRYLSDNLREALR